MNLKLKNAKFKNTNIYICSKNFGFIDMVIHKYETTR